LSKAAKKTNKKDNKEREEEHKKGGNSIEQSALNVRWVGRKRKNSDKRTDPTIKFSEARGGGGEKTTVTRKSRMEEEEKTRC
jgi:hypothetical protein